MDQDFEKKYFLLQPLRYLQSCFITTFSLSMFGFGYFELIADHTMLGWMFGMVAQPMASTALSLLLGYNLAFWIIRQSFVLQASTASL